MFTSIRRAGPGPSGRLRWLALATAALLAGFQAPAAAQPASTPQERADAMVRPAVVYLQIEWEGWVRDKRDGQLWDNESVYFVNRCTGFAVNETGSIVTAGHCVDPGPEGAGMIFFQAIVQRYVDAGLLDPSEFDAALAEIAANSEIEGEAGGDPPIRNVYVQHGVAVSGLDTSQAFPARVIDLTPVSQGDVALLKVDQAELPAVELATTDVPVGTEVLAIGYPGAADDISDATLEPSSKDGTISNLRTDGGVPVYETSAAITGGMSGGPVVGLEGQVIGLVSRGPGTSETFNFAAASSLITEMLAANGVTNQLSEADLRYREGLDAYFDGRYGDAIASLDAVLARIPSHQQAQEYRQLAVERQATEGDASSDDDGGVPAWLIAVAAGLGLLVIAGVVVLVLVLTTRGRNRRAAPATGPPAAMPAAEDALPPAGQPMPERPLAPAAGQPAPMPAREGRSATDTPATVAFPATGRAGPTPNSTSASPATMAADGPVAVAQSETATYCGNCGAAVAADGRFCTRCGAPVT